MAKYFELKAVVDKNSNLEISSRSDLSPKEKIQLKMKLDRERHTQAQAAADDTNASVINAGQPSSITERQLRSMGVNLKKVYKFAEIDKIFAGIEELKDDPAKRLGLKMWLEGVGRLK